MPALAPNPPLQRFMYVVKTYGQKYPEQVVDTLIVLADTVGEDHILRHDWAVDTWDRLPELSHWTAKRRHRMYQRYLAAAVEWFHAEPSMRKRHDSDVLWPWVARNLVKIRKRPEHRVRGEHGRLLPAGGDTGAHFWATRLFGKGPALTLWQNTERIDLGQYSLAAALEALETFEVENVEVPQGPVVYYFDDGWTVQKLMHEDEDVLQDMLTAEGEVMQHCVGDYCGNVHGGYTVIYSLRDSNGKPHVTMELHPELNRLVQIYGKQNTEPKPEYMERVEAFRAEHGILPTTLTKGEIEEISQFASDWARDLWYTHYMQGTIAVGEGLPQYPEAAEVIAVTLVGDYIDWEDVGLAGEIEGVASGVAEQQWGDLADENEEAFRDAAAEAASRAEAEARDVEDGAHGLAELVYIEDLWEILIEELQARQVAYQPEDARRAARELALDIDFNRDDW